MAQLCGQIIDFFLVEQNLAKSGDTDCRSDVLLYCIVHEQVALHSEPDLLGPWLDIAMECSLAAAGGYCLACSSLLNLIDCIM